MSSRVEELDRWLAAKMAGRRRGPAAHTGGPRSTLRELSSAQPFGFPRPRWWQWRSLRLPDFFWYLLSTLWSPSPGEPRCAAARPAVRLPIVELGLALSQDIVHMVGLYNILTEHAR